MKSVPRIVALTAVAIVASALTLPSAALADVKSPDLITPTAGATQINLIGFNDFHGRLLDAERFGATVLQAQQAFGEANSLVLSNGDAVSASIFESAIAKDEPTISALNAIGVDSFTIGNHEFDHGADDLTNRISLHTSGPDLAANITAADGSHPFEEYAMFDVNGISVGVIGAVTSETPALSAAGSTGSLTFGDPVAAVNRVAAQLSDGDASNGEADVLVASYHEGGPASDVPLAENEGSAVFAHIVNDTDARVAAIFTAHTHQTYAYDAPNGATTRPVVQAGSYANYIAQVVLTVDAEGAVTASDSSVIPTLEADAIPADIAADPRIAQVRTIVADAVAEADVLGSEKVGLQSGEITRAKIYTAGSITVDPTTAVASGSIEIEDDRSNASALSDMVAQSMVDVVNARGTLTADIGIMNPGGVRADLLDDDGVITYKEAATVLPFANDLSVVNLSTETLKAVLEQQWQRNGDNTVPSRPYLQLGLSHDFTYTYDSTRPEGDRITGMALRGMPMDAGQQWNVATNAFLAGGGDNFRALQDGTATSVGITDTDAFPTWLRTVSGDTGTVLSADNRRNGAEVRGLYARTAMACSVPELVMTGFDLASVGYVQNQTVTAELFSGTTSSDPVGIGEGVVNASAPNAVAFPMTVPAGTAGDAWVRLTAQPSGSAFVIPVVLDCPLEIDEPAPTTTATPGPALAESGADGQSSLIIGIGAGIVVIAGIGFFVISRRRKQE